MEDKCGTEQNNEVWLSPACSWALLTEQLLPLVCISLVSPHQKLSWTWLCLKCMWGEKPSTSFPKPEPAKHLHCMWHVPAWQLCQALLEAPQMPYVCPSSREQLCSCQQEPKAISGTCPVQPLTSPPFTCPSCRNVTQWVWLGRQSSDLIPVPILTAITLF